ncbi:MAG: VWA domain-containing protein [Planctomycetales bacterium]|nr:VWA domain-containing protein [Planctomycetales bacterium]
MIAFSIDIGNKIVAKGEIQRSVDAAAMAGAGMLVEGSANAQASVVEYLARNPAGTMTAVDQSQMETAIAEFLANHQDDVEIKVGHWDADAQQVIETDVRPSTVSVAFELADQPFFFAKLFGQDSFTVRAEAIASYQPRDIVLVLDLSGSMSYDSQFYHASRLGQTAIEDNLEQIYEELGSPTFGNMQFAPVYYSTTKTSKIKNYLGLNGVPYPYNSGSWNDYINYVKSSSTLNSVGYKKKYGYLTFMNYLLERRGSHSQTPELANVSAQPMQSVKDAVETFFSYMEEVDTDDRVGLSVYNASNGNGALESSLTNDYDLIRSLTHGFQAGHYHTYTNIGAGMTTARLELNTNARDGAYQMIVLLTDGNANWVNGSYNQYAARQYVLDEAALAAEAGYPIMTISLGADADQTLMQQVADITGGEHFNIPGGQAVSSYASGLKDAFEDIAKDRPLKLVK